MSLSDRLAEASKATKRLSLCKIGSIIHGTQLPEDDRIALKNMLDTPDGTPNRLNNATIGKVLREEGFDTSNMGGVSDINSMTGADIQAAMFQNTNRPDVRPQTNYNDVFGNQSPLVSASSFTPY